MTTTTKEERRVIKGEEAKVALERICSEGILPHLEKILPHALRGRFVCVVFEPGKIAKQMLKEMNRQSDGPVFVLTEKEATAFASVDPVTERWFAEPPSERKVKIFLAVHEGTLLVNFEPGQAGNPGAWSLEPGSADAEWKN